MNHAKAEVLVHEMQTTYPNVITMGDRITGNDHGGYCVGGVYVAHQIKSMPTFSKLAQRIRNFIGIGNYVNCDRQPGFVSPYEISTMLKKDNEKLNPLDAFCAASLIILYNDMGKFKDAWRTLELALSWHPGLGDFEKYVMSHTIGVYQTVSLLAPSRLKDTIALDYVHEELANVS